MCGRFELHTLVGFLALLFDFEESLPQVKPRHNIAPSQAVLAIRRDEEGKKRYGVLLRWGLARFSQLKGTSSRKTFTTRMPVILTTKGIEKRLGEVPAEKADLLELCKP